MTYDKQYGSWPTKKLGCDQRKFGNLSKTNEHVATNRAAANKHGGVYVFKANNSFYSYQKIKTYQRTVGVEPGKHVLWSDRRKIEDLRNRNLGFDQSK
jgi:hypothetical protein